MHWLKLHKWLHGAKWRVCATKKNLPLIFGLFFQCQLIKPGLEKRKESLICKQTDQWVSRQQGSQSWDQRSTHSDIKWHWRIDIHGFKVLSISRGLRGKSLVADGQTRKQEERKNGLTKQTASYAPGTNPERKERSNRSMLGSHKLADSSWEAQGCERRGPQPQIEVNFN